MVLALGISTIFLIQTIPASCHPVQEEELPTVPRTGILLLQDRPVSVK